MRIFGNSLLAMCFFSAALAAAANDAARPERGPIRYDARWEMHHVDPGFHAPADERRDSSRPRAAHTAPRSASRSDINVPRPDAPTYRPPPAPVMPDDRRRNWIIPTLDDDSDYGPRRDTEEQEPSGWGWLADEVNELRRTREREMEERIDDDERDSEDADRMLRGDRQETGLLRDGLFSTSPLIFEPPRDDEGDRNAADMRRESDDTTPESMRRQATDDAYGSVDPWETDQLNASPWAFDERDAPSESFASELPPVIFGAQGEATRSTGASALAPSFGTRPTAPTEPISRTVETPALGATAFGSMNAFSDSSTAIEPAFGRGVREDLPGTDFSPTADFGSRWGGEWSADSGWGGGLNQGDASRSTIITPSGGTSVGGGLHRSGWLADPDR